MPLFGGIQKSFLRRVRHIGNTYALRGRAGSPHRRRRALALARPPERPGNDTHCSIFFRTAKRWLVINGKRSQKRLETAALRAPTPPCMRTLDRYIFRQLLAPVGGAVAALAGVALLSQSLSQFDLVIEHGQNAWTFLKVTLFSMPMLAGLIFPHRHFRRRAGGPDPAAGRTRIHRLLRRRRAAGPAGGAACAHRPSISPSSAWLRTCSCSPGLARHAPGTFQHQERPAVDPGQGRRFRQLGKRPDGLCPAHRPRTACCARSSCARHRTTAATIPSPPRKAASRRWAPIRSSCCATVRTSR